MAPRLVLRALAKAAGILPSYIDVTGRERITSDASSEAILAAMGLDASSDARAAEALSIRSEAERERFVDAAVVAVAGSGRAPAVTLRIPGLRGSVTWEAELAGETGATQRIHGRVTGRGGTVRARLPRSLKPGFHRLTLTAKASAARRSGSTTLIVAPASCYSVRQALGRRAVFGLWANLYSLRSESDRGIGDFGDLRTLAEWGGEAGADFVGINPLHALWNRGTDISPYSPVSRLYRNPIYLDIAEIPEFAASSEARALAGAATALQRMDELRRAPHVDYAGVMEAKRPILEALHRSFRSHHGGGGTARGRAWLEYMEREGRALQDFAAFLVLDEVCAEGGRPVWWRHWPETYRDPRSPAVEELRRAHSDRIEFHCYLQFEVDRQLAAAAEASRVAGMSVGLYQDLAVGSSSGGSDSWSYPELFRAGATVGAPPDPHSASGQDWGLPPLDPNRLAADGYSYWIQLVRNAMTHAGALRIDHAMGLRRLFWIPAGQPATEGAYVRYPERELLAILALESQRQQALVIGEDLGTVPKGFGALLARWGILSSRVLYFERRDTGAFRPAPSYSPRALATVTTHDHPPLAAFWEGGDIDVRHSLGQIAEGDLAGARRARADERAALLARLRIDGLLPEDNEPTYPELCAAVHRFLARTPSPLIGVSLDDLSAEATPVNIPGVGPDQYPTWSRRMRLTLEQMRDDGGVTAGISAATRSR